MRESWQRRLPRKIINRNRRLVDQSQASSWFRVIDPLSISRLWYGAAIQTKAATKAATPIHVIISIGVHLPAGRRW
jgi:hypothetical protein